MIAHQPLLADRVDLVIAHHLAERLAQLIRPTLDREEPTFYTHLGYRFLVVFPDWDCAQGAAPFCEAGLGFGMLVVCETDGDRATCAARTIVWGILRGLGFVCVAKLAQRRACGVLAGFRPPWISLSVAGKFSRFSRRDGLSVSNNSSRRGIAENSLPYGGHDALNLATMLPSVLGGSLATHKKLALIARMLRCVRATRIQHRKNRGCYPSCDWLRACVWARSTIAATELQ